MIAIITYNTNEQFSLENIGRVHNGRRKEILEGLTAYDLHMQIKEKMKTYKDCKVEKLVWETDEKRF